MSSSRDDQPGPTTVTLLSLAHVRLSQQVAEGAARAGHPVKPSHSAVFGQMTAEGLRLTELARGANMTPQAMGELVTCSRCVGTWAAAGLATTQVLAPRFGRLLTWSLAAAGANDFLQAGFAALTRDG